MNAPADLLPLQIQTSTTPTALWNDSSNPVELSQSIAWGAVGATCNPVIALAGLKADADHWKIRIKELAAENPTATESEIGWLAVEELSINAAALLEPTFREHQGRNGRLSMQTDPRLHRNAAALVEQAVHFSELAPNIIVKIPATSVGIEAIEEATYQGVSINVTVSFSVPQALQAAEAIERGLNRRAAEDLPTENFGSVVTIMVGRIDDWLKTAQKREAISVEPGYLDWAGVAIFKRAYQIFTEQGYRSRLLVAAYRNHLQWAELIGADAVLSPPFAWQEQFNKSGITPTSRIDVPVDPAIIAALSTHFPEFVRAYEPEGLSVEEFDDFGPTRATLRQFLAADAELEEFVRDVLIPAP